MSTNELSIWLKYANMQMASEAFLDDYLSGVKTYKQVLIDGNKHASKFTETQATAFVAEYTVVAHVPNTGSGFSGTLFKDKAGNYTISFRSTEFVEDVIADSVGTNEGISQYGWAFGQIADMEDWWKALQSSVPDLKTKGFVITGYSLGGHLATAFAQLRAEENNGTPPAYLQHIYTYNGAGTGGIVDGKSLTAVMQLFIDVWKNRYEPPWLLNVQSLVDTEATNNFAKISLEASTVNGYVSGIAGDGTTPVVSRPGYFSDYRFHYAMAVAGRLTSGAFGETDFSAIFDSSKAAVDGMQFDGLMTELLGSGISSVAIGGLRHTSTRTEIAIEDQPLFRGVPRRAPPGPIAGLAPRLTNQYGLNDFADTHSLVLIVDSLAIMDTFAKLDPNLKQSTAERIFKAASAAKLDTVPGGQGKAEGDVLENILDTLVCIFTHTDPKLRDGKTQKGDDLNTGGTWADGTLRTAFYNKLDALQKSDEFTAVRGKVTVDVPNPGLLPTVARTDFASLLTLLTLSPFTLKAIAGKENEVETALKSKWGAEYTDWQADQALTPAQRAAGQGNYSETYLQDRALMLSGVVEANLRDTGNGRALYNVVFTTDQAYFEDKASGLSLREVNEFGIGNEQQRYVFGDEGNDVLFGKAGVDHLYGGAGMDRLDGGNGEDYLEGGSGSDTLSGGKGDDTLVGGQGFDMYLFENDQGWDLIEDADGQGTLYYEDLQLTGGEAVGDSGKVWKQVVGEGSASEKTFWYILSDWSENGQTKQRLSIQWTGPDTAPTLKGGLWIKDWKAGDLGITLPAATPPEIPDYPADVEAKLVAARDTNVWYKGTYYSTSTDDEFESQHTLTAVGPYGTVYGGGVLYGNEYANALSGILHFDDKGNGPADGHPLTTNDIIFGGAGRDVLRGNTGDDRLDGGEDGDLVAGGSGDDDVSGGAGDDWLMGGRGKDTLIGGAGNDVLHGDERLAWASASWSWAPPVDGVYQTADFSFVVSDGTMVPDLAKPGVYTHETATVGEDDLLMGNDGNDYLHGGAGNDVLDGGADADFLYGGVGNDIEYGGEGNDLIKGNAGHDTLEGDDGDDRVWGDSAEDSAGGNDLLRGGDGHDELFGEGGDDSLHGDSGNDRLLGDSDLLSGQYHGKDRLWGDEGNDFLYGGGEDDQLYGGIGDDYLVGDDGITLLDARYHGDDLLDGGQGNDTLFGAGGNDTLNGGEGNDILWGDAADVPETFAGNDSLYGGGGDDEIHGGFGNDTLIGGEGVDVLDGGVGDDTYIVGAGDALIVNGISETIYDSGGTDRLSLAVSVEALHLATDGSRLGIYWDNNTQGLIVDHGLQGAVERFSLAGEEVAWTDLLNRLLTQATAQTSSTSNTTMAGGAVGDFLIGTGGGTVFFGGRGDDRLYGGGANNKYHYSIGDGHDSILNEEDGTTATIKFGPGITPDDLKLSVVSNAIRSQFPSRISGSLSTETLPYALRINIGNNPGDIIDLLDFRSNGTLGSGSICISQFEFSDGTVLSAGELLSRGMEHSGTDARDYFIGTSLDDRMYGGDGDDYLDGVGGADYLSGGAGNDFLIGRKGSDVLDGGTGNDSISCGGTVDQNGNYDNSFDGDDIVIFRRGDGEDTVSEFGLEGDDAISLVGDIIPTDITVVKDQYDLIISINDSSDKIILKWFFGSESVVSGGINFSNGAVWTVDDIFGKFIHPTDGNDDIDGRSTGDIIDAGAGDDSISGRRGDDVLKGGTGNDYLNGGMGNDFIVGGEGDDLLYGGQGNDVFQFNLGDGQDTISDDPGGYPRLEDEIDILRLGPGILPSMVTIRNSTSWGSMIISFAGLQDKITVHTQFYEYYKTPIDIKGRIDQIVFDNGIVWDWAFMKSKALETTDGNDEIVGFASDDHIIGGDGDDFISGGIGGADVLEGGAGNDYLTVDAPGVTKTELFTDSILRGGDGHDFLVGGQGDDFLDGGDGNDSLTSHWGNDILVGGKGDDHLCGGTGSDTYVIGVGDGVDIISNYERRDESIGDEDRILFTEGITEADIGVWRRQDAQETLVLSTSESDWVEIPAYFSELADNAYGLRYVDFSDGTRWTNKEIYEKAIALESNTAPVVGVQIADQWIQAGEAFVLTIPESAFLDPDRFDYLVYWGGQTDGSPAIDWLEFDPISRAFRGTPPASFGGKLSVIVSVRDSCWAETSQTFNINVQAQGQTFNGSSAAESIFGGSGDDTLYGMEGDDYLTGGPGNDTYIFNRGDGQDSINATDILGASDTLSFGTGITDNEVLAFQYDDHLFLQLKGTNDQVAFIDYFGATFSTFDGLEADHKIDRVEFADGTVWDQAMIQTVLNRASGNHSPTVNSYLPTLQARAGSSFSYTVPADTITDPDAWDSITYSIKMPDGSAVPAWLQFDSANATMSGTPGSGNVGTLQFILWGTDNYNYSAGEYVNMTIGAPNKTPTLVTALTDQRTALGASFSYILPSNAFADPDGDALTYSATLADGSALPTWLIFNASTRTFSGIPDASGTTSIKVTAKDEGELGATDVFDIEVSVQNLDLNGTVNNDTLTGGGGNDTLNGQAGNDILAGGEGDDTLNGGSGADTLIGGSGSDTYVVDNTSDIIIEAANEGTDLVQSSVTHVLAANVENLTLKGTLAISGTGNALDNVLTGNSAKNTLTGGAGNDSLDGGNGSDTMVGGDGDDTYFVNISTDKIIENTNEGCDTVNSSVSLTLGSNLENLVLTGTSAINGTGNTMNNLLRGNTNANRLNGGSGNDILEGGSGNDKLTDTSGKALFNGGAGADTITGGASAEVFLGGLGNDTYTTAGGNDIILFNKGDGNDTFAAGGTGNDTLSLGGNGLSYADLLFVKSSRDLVLKVGTTDQITFKNWYATKPSKPVTRLQVMAEAMAGFELGGGNPLMDQKVETFDFTSLVSAFDAARAANSSLTSWSLSSALTDFQLAGSDTAAIGGDLAYQYGKNGTLAGIGVTPALTTLSDTNLGTNPQLLNSLAGLQSSAILLS